ncbi:MAG: aminodeoxychorismate/anthranilate synthase component II [Euryarchaeota archaeon]|nr:aminodeoxychorismate/anthranilate synthase component II [Euryarchaeota archaeon]
MPPRILVIDNYDSFTYNLVQYIGELGGDPVVYRNDAITPDEVAKLAPRGIVISPGPGNPAKERDFGVSAAILKTIARETPTLGVCLGLQGFAHHYGGRVVHAKSLMHGKTSEITHDGKGVFKGLTNPLTGGRYHSLVVEEKSLPAEIEVSARSQDGEVMGARHKRYPIEGVQFHPESILTEDGKKLITNFLEMAKE